MIELLLRVVYFFFLVCIRDIKVSTHLHPYSNINCISHKLGCIAMPCLFECYCGQSHSPTFPAASLLWCLSNHTICFTWAHSDGLVFLGVNNILKPCNFICQSCPHLKLNFKNYITLKILSEEWHKNHKPWNFSSFQLWRVVRSGEKWD